MAANITPVFKSTVKALIQTSDSQFQNSSGPYIDEENIQFRTVCQSVLKAIIKLRAFVLETTDEFVNISNNSNINSKLDFIDQEIETTIRLINVGLAQLRKDHLGSQFSEQVRQHRQAVIEILQKYMKNVVNSYKEQVDVRRKRISMQKKIAGHKRNDGLRKRFNAQTTTHHDKSTSHNSNISNDAGYQDSLDHNNEILSKEDMQIFAEENDALFDELNSMVNEVKNLESKITEIAQLQDMFTEQVLKQEKDIDRIAQTAVTTTENVKGGNEQLREAMRNQSTMRFWVLFFVIVCTLTLIFLDWYNP